MMFGKLLRPRVQSGEITTSVRIWQSPRVKLGGRYPLLDGQIEVTGLTEIDLADVTNVMAQVSGFPTLEALMETARHGHGERVFLVEFVFEPSGSGG